MNKERALNMFRTANQWLYDKLGDGALCECGNCYLCAYNFFVATASPAVPRDEAATQDELVDEVQHRMDQVVEAAVEWHQAGREGGEWFEAAERLGAAINLLLELRDTPSAPLVSDCDPDD